MDPEEQEGVKMIQALLSLHGSSESTEQSLQGWRNMSIHERAKTLYFYEELCVGGHA
jgi:hypothetical protein